jgi:hypothetical protein
VMLTTHSKSIVSACLRAGPPQAAQTCLVRHATDVDTERTALWQRAWYVTAAAAQGSTLNLTTHSKSIVSACLRAGLIPGRSRTPWMSTHSALPCKQLCMFHNRSSSKTYEYTNTIRALIRQPG